MTMRLSLAAIALLAVMASWQLLGSQDSSASDTVSKVALDLEITNEIANQPNGPIGRAQPCTPGITFGQTVDLDVLVYDVPAAGMSGFTMEVTYSGFVVEVTDVEVEDRILGQAAGSGPYQVTHESLPDSSGTLTIEATDLGSGFETGDGVLARIQFRVIALGTSQITISSVEVTASDGQPMTVDTVFDAEVEAGGGGCISAWPEVCNNAIDDDWDSRADEPEPWPLAADDEDCDGFSAADEAAIGTEANSRCFPFLPTEDQWPPDFDGNNLVNISDVLSLKPVFGSAVPPASARQDIVPGGGINISDVLRLKPFFGADCLN